METVFLKMGKTYNPTVFIADNERRERECI
ncbi:hypothetical protein J2Y02_001003 [Neobacillus drentensis]|nr:hypothetical protein [Neobacillus drentensis]